MAYRCRSACLQGANTTSYATTYLTSIPFLGLGGLEIGNRYGFHCLFSADVCVTRNPYPGYIFFASPAKRGREGGLRVGL